MSVTDDGSVTRSLRRRLGYATVTTLLTLLVLGLPFSIQSGVAITQVAELAEALERPPLAVDGATDGAHAQEPTGDSAVAQPVVSGEPAPAPPPAPEPGPAPEPCAAALDGVAAGGLPLPAGVDYQCPSTRFAHQGAACWDDWPCPGTAFIAINMSRLQGVTPEYLRHVVAHEICHIIDFRDRGWSTEPRADACAAEYGF